ncbi:hypothetical protein MRX96_013408 [Rhipicephalus microplus]
MFETCLHLLQHSIAHINQLPFWCSHCGAAFAHSEDMAKHEAQHGNRRGKHRCIRCDRVFVNRTRLWEHVQSHYGSPDYTCHLCSAVFPLQHQLSKHLRTHGNELPFVCEQCNSRFMYKESLCRHKRVHQGVRNATFVHRRSCPKARNDAPRQTKEIHEDNGFMSTAIEREPSDIGDEQSREVGVEGPAKGATENGVAIQGTLTPRRSFQISSSDQCEAAATGTTLQMTGGREDNECISEGSVGYECGVCGEVFDTHNVFLQHSIVHKKEWPFWCSLCGANFPSRLEMAEHEKTHPDKHQRRCLICSKDFGHRTLLRDHMRRHKSGHATLKCNLCPMVFTTKQQLLKHVHSHPTSTTRLECGQCGATFIKEASLIEHHKMHAERPFACDLCGKRFVQHFQLVTHSRKCTEQ